MPEKRMLIVPEITAKKIDENRGDMGQAEFIEFLIDSHFKQEDSNNGRYVSREQFLAFEQGMKELFRTFLDFFLSLGLEMDTGSSADGGDEFNMKLKSIEERLDPGQQERTARIKWK